MQKIVKDICYSKRISGRTTYCRDRKIKQPLEIKKNIKNTEKRRITNPNLYKKNIFKKENMNIKERKIVTLKDKNQHSK